jgi:hypothetical protein
MLWRRILLTRNEGRYRALLIGNWTFCGRFKNLNGPKVDVDVVAQALCNADFGVHKWEDVKLVKDKTSTQIRDELAAFFADAKMSDQLLVYYSGHGITTGLTTPQLRLVARDTDDAPGRLHSRTVGMAWINELAADTPAKQTVVVLDCCFSGAALDHLGRKGAASSPAEVQWEPVKAHLTPGKGHGICVIAAGPSHLEAKDSTAAGEPSPFTKDFAEALAAAESNEQGWVTSREICAAIEKSAAIPPEHLYRGSGSFVLARRDLGSRIARCFHPPQYQARRTPLPEEPCKFQIDPGWNYHRDKNWTEYGDVQILVEGVGDRTYLIPSGASPQSIHDPSRWKQHGLIRKKRITEDWCKENGDALLDGFLFQMTRKDGSKVPRLYCVAYDQFLWNAVNREKQGGK